MAHSLEIDYYNTLVLKRYMDNMPLGASHRHKGAFNPSYSNTAHPSLDFGDVRNTYIEESRIKGGFNQPFMDKGPKAYADNDEKREATVVISGLIHSGPLNNSTGLNETNFFSVADTITRQADPVNGSIQLLYAEDTNLIVLQELKASRAMIDKDIIYTAEGTGLTTAGARVIGQINPYAGEYGISKNPESFGVYGFQKYFVDKNRGSVIRLSANGTTAISDYGMRDFFRDQFLSITDSFKDASFFTDSGASIDPQPYSFVIASVSTALVNGVVQVGDTLLLKNIGNNSVSNTGLKVVSTTLASDSLTVVVSSSLAGSNFLGLGNTFTGLVKGSNQTHYVGFSKKHKDKIVGAYDQYSKTYILSLQNKNASLDGHLGNTQRNDNFKTLYFDEGTNSWTSFLSFHPDHLMSYNNKLFSTNPSGVYKHYVESVANNYGKFYGLTTNPYIDIVFNKDASNSKIFKTMEYEGDSGWKAQVITSDKQGPVRNVNSGTNTTVAANTYLSTFSTKNDSAVNIHSYLEGRYELVTPANTGLSAVRPPYQYAGFRRYENKYYANLVNSSTQREGEVAFGSQISGIKGHFMSVRFTTDSITEAGNKKELFSVGTNVI